MIALQVLYFLAAAGMMAAIGAALLIPPLRDADREMLYARMIASFGAKLLVGAGLMLLSWKVIGWSAVVSAFGSVGAYMAALLAILILASSEVKKLKERTAAEAAAGTTTTKATEGEGS